MDLPSWARAAFTAFVWAVERSLAGTGLLIRVRDSEMRTERVFLAIGFPIWRKVVACTFENSSDI